MRRALSLIVMLLAATASVSPAQSSTAPSRRVAPHSAPASKLPMTNQDVIKLAKAGFSEDVILSSINAAAKTSFDSSADALVSLKLAGVPESVIKRMLSGATGTPALVSSTGPTTTSRLATVAPAPAKANRFPTEVGVYRREGADFKEVLPEIVNWRTGGFWKRVATGGLIGGHVNGWVTNPSAPTQVTLPIEFVICAPEGTSVTEYQLLKFFEKETRREFRAMSSGVVNAKSGADANVIEFAGEKVAPRTFVIRIQNLPRGEYGFLPPGLNASSLAASGKVYSFNIR